MGHAQDMGRRIAALRKERRLTQAEASDAIGIARGTLGTIERGHDKPGRDALAAIARFYGVSMDYLEGSAAAPGHLAPQNPENSLDESAILLVWRLLNDSQKRRALAAMDAILQGGDAG